jgi:hypothetical protein
MTNGRSWQGLLRTLAALGLLRPLAKEVDALEVMAAIVYVFQMELLLELMIMLVMYPCRDSRCTSFARYGQ